ncbi:MAG: hypothetical protein AAF153_02180, partial [Pseudomonadota bacterium]
MFNYNLLLAKSCQLHKWLRTAIIILLLSILGGCGDDCIEADDFGFPKLSIDARYSQSDISYESSNPNPQNALERAYGKCNNQFVPWKKLNYVTQGNHLIIGVKGGWNPFGTKYGGIEVECKYQDDSSLDKIYTGDFDRDDRLDITNAPCQIVDAGGLYMLLRDPKENHPNQNPATINNPEAYRLGTFHMGGNADDKLSNAYESRDGHMLKGFNGSPKDIIATDSNPEPQVVPEYEMFFKIKDDCYTDNSGSYKLVMKKGYRDPTKKTFIQSLIDTVKNTVNTTAEAMFKSITGNNDFRNFARLVLIFYVIYQAYSFLLGVRPGASINEAPQFKADFFMDLAKVCIIAVLLSDEAWSFFYNNFFVIAIEGVDDLIAMIAPVQGYSDGHYDHLAQKYFTYEVWMKIVALL